MAKLWAFLDDIRNGVAITDGAPLKKLLLDVPDPLERIMVLMANNTLGTILHSAALSGLHHIIFVIVEVLSLHRDSNREEIYKLMRIPNDGGDTVIHNAAYHGHQTMITNILACLQQEYKYTLLSMQDTAGYTALHYAVLKGHVEVVKAILNPLEPEEQVNLLKNKCNKGHSVLDIPRHPDNSAISCVMEYYDLANMQMRNRQFIEEVNDNEELAGDDGRIPNLISGSDDTPNQVQEVETLRDITTLQQRKIEELEQSLKVVHENSVLQDENKTQVILQMQEQMMLKDMQHSQAMENMRQQIDGLCGVFCQLNVGQRDQAGDHKVLTKRVTVVEEDVEYLMERSETPLSQPSDQGAHGTI